MAVAWGSIGAISLATSTATTSVAVPASIAAGDLLVMVGAVKLGPTAQPAVAGWTARGFISHGTTASGNDAGSMRLMVWTKEATTSESAVTITWGTTPNAGQAFMYRLTKTAGNNWLVAGAGISRTATTTAWSVTYGSDPGLASGDFLAVVNAVPTDLNTASSAGVLTATGLTSGSATERITHQVDPGGSDSAIWMDSFAPTAGSATSAATYTSTLTGGTNLYGVSFLLRVRDVAPATPVAIADGFEVDGALNGRVTSVGNKTWVANSTHVTSGGSVVAPTTAVGDYQPAYFDTGATTVDVSMVLTAAIWDDHGFIIAYDISNNNRIGCTLRTGQIIVLDYFNSGNSNTPYVINNALVVNGGVFTLRATLNQTTGAAEVFLDGVSQLTFTSSAETRTANNTHFGLMMRASGTTYEYRQAELNGGIVSSGNSSTATLGLGFSTTTASVEVGVSTSTLGLGHALSSTSSEVAVSTSSLTLGMGVTALASEVEFSVGSVGLGLELSATSSEVEVSTSNTGLGFNLSATSSEIAVSTATVGLGFGTTSTSQEVAISTATVGLGFVPSATSSVGASESTATLSLGQSLSAVASEVEFSLGTVYLGFAISAVSTQTSSSTANINQSYALSNTAEHLVAPVVTIEEVSELTSTATLGLGFATTAAALTVGGASTATLGLGFAISVTSIEAGVSTASLNLGLAISAVSSETAISTANISLGFATSVTSSEVGYSTAVVGIGHGLTAVAQAIGSSTASVSLGHGLSAVTEVAGQSNAGAGISYSVSATTSLVVSSTANLTVTHSLSATGSKVGISTAALTTSYTLTSQVEAGGSSTATLSVSYGLTSAADSTRVSTATVRLIYAFFATTGVLVYRDIDIVIAGPFKTPISILPSTRKVSASTGTVRKTNTSAGLTRDVSDLTIRGTDVVISGPHS